MKCKGKMEDNRSGRKCMIYCNLSCLLHWALTIYTSRGDKTIMINQNIQQNYKAKNMKTFSQRSAAIWGRCWGKRFNILDDAFGTARLSSWWLFSEAIRSAGNNIKCLVIWCRSAAGVTVSNDLGNAARSQEELNHAILQCFFTRSCGANPLFKNTSFFYPPN